jgi:hypothetical protein
MKDIVPIGLELGRSSWENWGDVLASFLRLFPILCDKEAFEVLSYQWSISKVCAVVQDHG